MIETHEDLVRHLVHNGALLSPHIIAAFVNVDRKDFVRADTDPSVIYANHPLPIGEGQTISQPSTVAFMLELLHPQAGEKILDAGSGSGWTTALLAHIVGTEGAVYGVEIVPALVDFGARNLAKYNFSHATILPAGKEYGLPKYAPFDKILVSAAGKVLPQNLIAQLAPDGVLVMPVEHAIVRYSKKTDTAESFHGFSFVPLIDPHKKSSQ